MLELDHCSHTPNGKEQSAGHLVQRRYSSEAFESVQITSQSVNSTQAKDTKASDSTKNRGVTITEPIAALKDSASSLPQRRFSADPALEIRGILKTPTSTPASAHREINVARQNVAEISIEAPPPSSQR